MTTLIRLAIDADRPVVEELARSFCAAAEPPIAFSNAAFDGAWSGYIANATPSVFVAEVDRKVVAAAAATIDYDPASGSIVTTLRGMQGLPGTDPEVFERLTKHLIAWTDMLGAVELRRAS